MEPGKVYWITGISGAGKTTLARFLYNHLLAVKPNVVFLDGDKLREVFGNDLGHSRDERLKSAMRNAHLCKMLSDQGIEVVCATISLFHSCQNWNRDNITNYIEVFIDAPVEVAMARDHKGLYEQARNQAAVEMVGLQIKEERPVNPDVIIANDGSRCAADVAADLIKAVSSLS